MPLVDTEGLVCGVAELLNKVGGGPFDADDERRFTDLIASMSTILRSWNRQRAVQESLQGERDP